VHPAKHEHHHARFKAKVRSFTANWAASVHMAERIVRNRAYHSVLVVGLKACHLFFVAFFILRYVSACGTEHFHC